MRRVRWATLALSGSLLMFSGCCWDFGWFSRCRPCCECDPCCCGNAGAVGGFEGPVLAQPEPFMAPGAMPPPAPTFPGTAPPPIGTPTAPPPRIVPVPQAYPTPAAPTSFRKWRRW